MEKSQKITFNDVVLYVTHNSDNTREMDIINNITFPFTTKYKNWREQND